jgi:hypothetical protein
VKAEFGEENVLVIFKSQEGPNLIIKSKIEVTDTTYGVFSMTAYQSHLSEEINKQINRNVEEIFTKY